MLLNKDTKEIQSSLANYCRTGELREIEGARTDRLHNYRRLSFNIINDTMANAYPILHEILSVNEWSRMTNGFFREHDSQTNQVWKLPHEFYTFAVEQNFAEQYNRPYLNELMYLEWIEIELFNKLDTPLPENLTSEGDLLDDEIYLNPDLEVIHFEFPVHLKRWEELADLKGNYFMLAYRNPKDEDVSFMNISPLYALAINEMIESKLTAREAIIKTGKSMGITDENVLIQNSLPFFGDLFVLGVFMGYLS